jgi:uncharacterized protein (TIGR03086 family)
VAFVPAAASILVDQLSRSFAAVGQVIGDIEAEQWEAPTPCTDWTVRRVVGHLVGMNDVFTALLDDEPPPRREGDLPGAQLERAFRESAATLLAAFSGVGVLDRIYRSPFGAATGADRLQIRLYDLLAHGWDLARATGRAPFLPDDAAERALDFARAQLTDDARPGRFGPALVIDPGAPAIDRLAAFLGRRVDWAP